MFNLSAGTRREIRILLAAVILVAAGCLYELIGAELWWSYTKPVVDAVATVQTGQRYQVVYDRAIATWEATAFPEE